MPMENRASASLRRMALRYERDGESMVLVVEEKELLFALLELLAKVIVIKLCCVRFFFFVSSSKDNKIAKEASAFCGTEHSHTVCTPHQPSRLFPRAPK